MSTNALFSKLQLNNNQVQAAVSFNQGLKLSQRSTRLLQSVLGTKVTGTWGKDETTALLHPDFSQGYITKEFIIFAQKNPTQVSSIGGIPTTFNGILGAIDKISSTGFWDQIKDKLGRLNEPILQGVIEDMKNKKQSSQALMIAADYFKHKLDDSVLQLAYNPNLRDSFKTKVAFSSQAVSSSGSISSAPHPLIQIQLGNTAFDNIEALKKVLKDAFSAKPSSINPPRLSSSLSGDKKKRALGKGRVRFAHTQSVKILQAITGAPVTGTFDESTVDGIAQFQRSAGLGVDGIVGKGQTLPALIKKALNEDLFEAAIHLVTGYFNMNADALTYTFSHFEPSAATGFQTNVPGALFYHAGANLKSLKIKDYLNQLCPSLNSMMLYKGSNFTGPHSARIDVAFLPAIEKVNALAGQHGVKIFVSGPKSASFRPEGTVVQGAIVTPSKRSNHKIGHAIDMNIIAGSTHMNSKALNPSKESQWPSSVKNFINAIRQDSGLRWGGDFNTPDPVHIDDHLNNQKPEIYEQRFIATQTSYPYFEDASRSIGGDDEVLCEN